MNLPVDRLGQTGTGRGRPRRGTRARRRPCRRASARRRRLSKPAPASSCRYSASSSAPATQPIHSSMLLRTSAGTSPRTTTSDTAKRPPGLSTRNASRSTRGLSPDRLITQLEMMTSTELSGSGMCSISPLRNSTFVDAGLAPGSRAPAPASRRSCRGRRPCRSARRACAESSTSMPPPEPRSSTVSPGLQLGQRRRDCRSRATPPRPLRQAGLLVGVVEVRGDRVGPAAAGRAAATANRLGAAGRARRRLAVFLLHRGLEIGLSLHRCSFAGCAVQR